MLQAFHILNNFDIPQGAAREAHKDAHGNIVADYTLWTSACDLQAKRFYFRTYANSQIRSVDLMKMPLERQEHHQYFHERPGGHQITDPVMATTHFQRPAEAGRWIPTLRQVCSSDKRFARWSPSYGQPRLSASPARA